MVPSLRKRIPVQSLILAVWLAAAAAAQTMPPTIQLVSPPGVMPGSYFDLVIQGRNLGGTSRIVFLTPGISGTIESVAELSRGMKSSGGETGVPIEDPSTENRVVARVAVESTVAPGHQLFRLATPLGTSNIGGFEVNTLPLTAEREKNNTREEAQEITMPMTVNGQISGPDDADVYAFEAKDGQPVVCEIVARALDSSLDGALQLFDTQGRLLVASGGQGGSDPSVGYKIPADGKYYVEVRDLNNAGGPNFFYRLSVYLGEAPSGAGPRLIAGQPAPPTGYGGGFNEVNNAEFAPITPPSGQMPILMSVKGSVMSEEGDLIHFSAQKGQRIIVETAANRVGSPLDSAIEILDAEKRPIQVATARALAVTQLDQEMSPRSASVAVLSTGGFHVNDYVWIGNELLRVAAIPQAQNPTLTFETAGPARVSRMNTTSMQYGPNEKIYRVDLIPAGQPVKSRGLPTFPIYYANDDGGPGYGKDSRIDFTAPAEGDYFVRIRDARGERGEAFVYRLSIREPIPAFQLVFNPANPNVPRGGRVPITVNANRTDGFNEPIGLAVTGLPRGLHAVNGRIPPGQFSTTLAIEADQDAPDAFSSFRISGTSGDLKADAGPREAVGSNILAGVEDMTPLSLASVASPPDITITAEPRELALKPGQRAALTLHIRRAPSFKARVPFIVPNLPPGVTIGNIGLNGIVIGENENARTIEIEADAAAQPADQQIYAIGFIETNSPIPQRLASQPVNLRVLPGDGTGAVQTASAGAREDR